MKNIWAEKKFIFIVSAIFLWILMAFIGRGLDGSNDFNVFYHAGERLLNHENIYEAPHYLHLKYFYSVGFAFLMAAFQLVGIFASKVIWNILSMVLFIRIAYLIRFKVIQNSQHADIILFLSLLFSAKIILYNFLAGQLTILMLWVMMESTYQLGKAKVEKAMFILALGCTIKILPILILPWIFLGFQHFKKSVLYFSAFTVLLVLFPFAFTGFELGIELTISWLKSINPISSDHIMQTNESGMLDIGSMVTKYFSAQQIEGETDTHLVELSPTGIFLLTNLLRLILFSLAVFIALFKQDKIVGIDSVYFKAAAFMALIPLLIPHQRYYSFLLSLPLLAIILHKLFQSKNKGFIILGSVCILFSGFLAWDDLVGKNIAEFYTDYRITTIGMSVLFILYFLIALFDKNQNNFPR